MTRIPDWRLHFDAVVYSRARTPFAWGTNDCALFAADCVLAMTGMDPAAGLRGHHNARQAARTLRRHGGLAAVATRALGPPCATAGASQGDVVLVPVGSQVALGVCIDSCHAVGPTRVGLATLPLSVAICIWKV